MSKSPNSPALPASPSLTELPPAIQAASNLRCPSPPPILNNLRVTTPAATLPPSARSPPDRSNRETVPAGGALLKDKVVLPQAQLPAAPRFSVSNLSELNLEVSLDYTLHPPGQSVHHKAPSVHAHFYADEAQKPVKAGNRSRSGSASASGSEGAPQRRDERLALPTAIGSAEQSSNIDPRLPQDDGKIHVLLGVCGAISTMKIKLIILKLFEIYGADKISIQLILTKASENFISPEALHHLETNKKVRVWRDSDEWSTWNSRLDPVVHIELRRWADILIVCPLTANTLAKISLGLCDNLLTNVIRAWNTAYPILLAPAMVSNAYNAAATKRQLRVIAEEMPWMEILKPVEKVVGSYGDIGMGGMMDWNEIVNKVVMKLGGYPEEDDDEDDDLKNNDNDHAIADDDDDDDDDDNNDDDDDDDDDDDEEDAENDEVSRVKKEVLDVAAHDLAGLKVA